MATIKHEQRSSDTTSMCVLALAMLTACSPAQAPVRSQPATRETTIENAVGFMVGCWRGPTLEENYQRDGARITGSSRFLEDGHVVQTETTVIAQDPGTHTISMINTVNGTRTEPFQLHIPLLETHAVLFENPTHDFPQRISYALAGDTLTARIEGSENGTTRSIEWVMHRAPCEK